MNPKYASQRVAIAQGLLAYCGCQWGKSQKLTSICVRAVITTMNTKMKPNIRMRKVRIECSKRYRVGRLCVAKNTLEPGDAPCTGGGAWFRRLSSTVPTTPQLRAAP